MINEPIFSLTAAGEWQAALEEYFEETAVTYKNFKDETEFKAVSARPWSLGLLGPKQVSKPRLFASIRLMKLGEGECCGVSFGGRLDLPLSSPAFQETLMGVFPESLQSLMILLIDDDLEFCEEMKNYWQSKKIPPTSVEIATNGLEGLEKYKSCHPNIIIVDLKMPVMSGIDFYKQLRKIDKKTPVLILTAVSEAEEIAKLKRIGNPVCVEKSSHESLPENLWWRALKLRVLGSRDLR